ncbi:sorbosone dehydrogenase family protein [Kibdelosporangium persicum]|uniref:Soluble aldose sugar dehydrogenase YliI n=1 Tax=Kibdelosporangium persicum TaxID=2698649 RepID=A0ABX2F003_9PSEU|nr:PQQ-dependent sugar dehydrogenase [Kibdelosporangium persicum]NRN64258.1 Soluble aldose sugar dehydrogenase YliI [Kibdelosporangium persicum]
MKLRTSLVMAAAAITGLTFSAVPAQAATTVVASQLAVPWGLGFLPDGTAVFTERNTAKIRQLRGGVVSDVQTVPGVSAQGEGGLLGLAVSPQFAQDQTVFIYYTTASDNRIARVVLGQAPQPIVTGIPKANIHNGGRLAFGPDGLLYAGTGDAANSANSQNQASLAGKILRMTPDGRPAPGNPFNSLVYSLGHRNVQGLTWSADGRLFSAELGQNTWDELNQITSGGNYGWPTCEGRCNNPSYVDPLQVWSTAQASPSGIAFYNNNLYMAGLRGQRMWVIPVTGTGVGTPRALYQNQFGRLRTPVAGPDGNLYFTTSNRDGRGSPVAADDRIVRSDGA